MSLYRLKPDVILLCPLCTASTRSPLLHIHIVSTTSTASVQLMSLPNTMEQEGNTCHRCTSHVQLCRLSVSGVSAMFLRVRMMRFSVNWQTTGQLSHACTYEAIVYSYSGCVRSVGTGVRTYNTYGFHYLHTYVCTVRTYVRMY